MNLVFDLIATVFDYGEAISSISIKVPSGVDQNSINKDTFTILASAKNPFEVVSDEHRQVYTRIKRQINAITYDEDGNILINLHCEYNGEGQSTLSYDVTCMKNFPLFVDYEIQQKKEFLLSDGTLIKPETTTYIQRNLIDSEVDAFTSHKAESSEINYRMFEPKNHNDGQAHPLIIWFHGYGEGGHLSMQIDSTPLTGNRGALGFASPEAQELFGGAYVIAPQCPDTWYYNDSSSYDKKIMEIIKELKSKYPIDESRIYIAGASAGGYMTISMLIDFPDAFAAAVPVCPALVSKHNSPERVYTKTEYLRVKESPIWLIHAKNDPTIEMNCTSKPVYDTLKPYGNCLLTEFENVLVDRVEYPGHCSWIYAARNIPRNENGESLWAWMAKQKLTKK